MCIWETNPGKDIDSSRPSPVTFHDFRETAQSFEHLTGWWHPDLNLTSGEGEPLRCFAGLSLSLAAIGTYGVMSQVAGARS